MIIIQDSGNQSVQRVIITSVDCIVVHTCEVSTKDLMKINRVIYKKKKIGDKPKCII